MTKNFKGRRAFILIMAIMLTITLIPGTAFAGNGQTEQRIHLDQSIGSNHDVIVVSYDNGSFEGSVTGGGTNLTVDMESMVNLFDFYGESSITVNYQNVTSGATGSLTLSHQEGHADGSLSEPDMGLNNLRGSVIPDQPQSGDEPPAGGGDEPPAGGGDEPPAGGGDEPPAGGGDEPPAGGGEEPPAGGNEPPQLPVIPYYPPYIPPVIVVPAVEEPVAEEVMVIEEPEVPLAEEPEFEEPVEIEEPEVPLAEVPKTGDNMMVWLLAAILSLIGAAITFRRKNEA